MASVAVASVAVASVAVASVAVASVAPGLVSTVAARGSVVAAPANAAWAPAPHATAVMVARYGFDHPSGSLVDQSGHGHTLRRLTYHRATTRLTAHRTGNAMTFPGKCTGGGCPRAVLQAAHAGDLNPGTRRISFGATVRLLGSQTSRGQNIVQKGNSSAEGLYKLQVDGSAGRPSCVVVDRRIVRVVTSDHTVADGGWHRIACRRAATTFSVAVDGRVRGTTRVPANLSIGNARPLDIGGKGPYFDNDQFHGTIDDIFVIQG